MLTLHSCRKDGGKQVINIVWKTLLTPDNLFDYTVETWSQAVLRKAVRDNADKIILFYQFV